jgi:hypothetical protein
MAAPEGPQPPAPGERPAAADRSAPEDRPPPAPAIKVEPPRYGRYVLLLAFLILIAITINTVVTKPNGDKGVPVGRRIPPFAVPLALSDLEGDANVATRPDEGEAGHVPACSIEDTRAMNVCNLYKGVPLVLAMFIDAGSCADVLRDMQALAPAFPRVRFAAVAIRSSHSSVRKLVQKLGLTFPVGVDRSGTLAALYSVATCPQISFIEPGGTVQSPALLVRPPRSQLRARVAELLAASGGAG